MTRHTTWARMLVALLTLTSMTAACGGSDESADAGAAASNNADQDGASQDSADQDSAGQDSGDDTAADSGEIGSQADEFDQSTDLDGDGPAQEIDVGDADEGFAAAGELLAEVVAAEGLNGAGLVVVDADDGVIFEHYEGDFSADRVSLIASSSKMITAGVLMSLHDQGLVDVDAPVADAVAWGSANPDITPIQLLSNSSGLVGLVGDGRADGYICQYVATGTLQGCAENIFSTDADDEFVIEPDTDFRYGGAQWQVAGGVAEATSGKTWDELIEETYRTPCGVDSLAYNNHYTQIVSPNGPFEHPPQFDGDPSVLADTANPNMEGGAYISPADYAALLMMHLNEGRCGDQQVLSAESIERMHADRILEAYDGETGGGLEGYGLGWWVDRHEGGPISDGGAFGSVPWLDMERGYGAYLVIEDTSSLGSDISEDLIPLVTAAVDARA